MHIQVIRSLALLATVTAVLAADDVVTITLPDSDAMAMTTEAQLVGTATDMAASFDDEGACWIPDEGYTMTVGSNFLAGAITTMPHNAARYHHCVLRTHQRLCRIFGIINSSSSSQSSLPPAYPTPTPSTSPSGNGAMILATGAAQLVAGGAAAMVALAMDFRIVCKSLRDG
ncbi:hypothetical protein BBP40_002000 [Aspergillus hancockii]|nr:hypothetical protein BBP40_002000 [Aspergillus hancockii]